MAESGENIDRSRKLFKRKVTTLCQPLVRVQDTETPHGTVTTCTLTHSTVRNFLLKRAQDDGTEDDRETLRIVPDTLADICLKYLMQPRFAALLKREGHVFKDELDEDIDSHHLLPYAAKYWDKHLDVASQWKSFCDPVKDFVRSPQFFTCLQVQSLLVGGKIDHVPQIVIVADSFKDNSSSGGTPKTFRLVHISNACSLLGWGRNAITPWRMTIDSL